MLFQTSLEHLFFLCVFMPKSRPFLWINLNLLDELFEVLTPVPSLNHLVVQVLYVFFRNKIVWVFYQVFCEGVLDGFEEEFVFVVHLVANVEEGIDGR